MRVECWEMKASGEARINDSGGSAGIDNKREGTFTVDAHADSDDGVSRGGADHPNRYSDVRRETRVVNGAALERREADRDNAGARPGASATTSENPGHYGHDRPRGSTSAYRTTLVG